jgi:hypothetical protein
MSVHIPCYINESQSGLRGIKDGWYAVDREGTLSFGPFSNREDCLSRIHQLMSWSAFCKLRQRTN